MKTLLGILIFLLSFSEAFAAEALEMPKGQKFYVMVPENADADELEVGLTPDYLRTQVEIRLRRNGLNIIEPTDPNSSVFFHIDVTTNKITVGGIPRGYAIGWQLTFWREVSYLVKGKRYSKYAPITYRGENLIVGRKDEAKAIVSESIFEGLDDISNEILKYAK